MDPAALPPPTTKDTQAYRIASTIMKLLNDESVPQALWWLDDQTFAADPKFFQTQVLDPFFRGTKYASFLRTMHKMGFARLSRRFDLPKGVVAYACELFRKEKPELMHNIRMCNSGKQAQALKAAMAKAKKKNEPEKKKTDVKEAVDKKVKAILKATNKATAAVDKKPDPPTSPKSTKKSAVELLQTDSSAEPSPAASMKPVVNPATANNARIHLLREQAALELNAQRMFLQHQHLQAQQDHFRRVQLLAPPMRPALPANLLELALLQEALANRLTGPR